MRRVESRVAEMMSRRITELVVQVGTMGLNRVLTDMIRLVSPTCPFGLEWKQVSDGDGETCGRCFEDADAHYAINLFTGVVLTDGNAPGGLPTGIREHERFLALFGRCNFEVVREAGVLRMQRQYCDRLYDFALETGEELFVQELTVDAVGEVTETLQLCSAQWVQTFSTMFPARLRELYSHWYWEEKNCILFRPKEAKCRKVFFVARFDASGALQCYKVPFCDWERPYEEILGNLDDYDRFVQRSSLPGVLQVLSNFEDGEFLHPLKSSKGVIAIELPRFRLAFRLNSKLKFESVEHKGYILAMNQQFDDFLPRFSRYLVLELQDKSDTARPVIRMLLPVGFVEEAWDGMVDINIPTEADSFVDVACYDVHRRLKTFEAETSSARLQLAAVCTLAGTNVPSKRLQMTGAQAAVQMLRACRPSGLYSSFEVEILQSICKLSFREPAVKILAVSLLGGATRLAFLFDQDKTVNLSMAGADEKAEYSDMCVAHTQRNPLRCQLMRSEERRVLGKLQHSSTCNVRDETIVLESPGEEDYVNMTEARLQRFLSYETGEANAMFPLELNTPTNMMIHEIIEELRTSWDCHHSQRQMKLEGSKDTLVGSFAMLLEDISSRRKKLETCLYGFYSKATSGTRDQLLTLVNFSPKLTIIDLVRCALDDETLLRLAPRLSEGSRTVFKKTVLQFMELCVLEDKLERLVWKSSHRDELSDSQILDELVNSRQWDSAKYPYWLAFEVEGRLQIRHEQLVVAQHLIDRPGTVCQLNMGRGKTRVILPMLFLHFAHSQDGRIVRAHFLGSLLGEACQYIHRYLSASASQLCILEQPFHRQIGLDVRKLEVIHDVLQEMKMFGGIQVVAPEHRMSLELKRLELDEDDEVSADLLDEILDTSQYIDVLDECDAVLHHKYHLVYAAGRPIALNHGVERWEAAEALLGVIASKRPESRVRQVLQAPHVACSPNYVTRLGAYEGTRLNATVDSTVPLRKQLKEALALDLINKPELMWLNMLGNGAARASLIVAITDSTVSLEAALGEHMQKLSPYVNQLLALRGLVAFEVLEHCSEKRYRVDFGLPLPETRPKRIAIPFCAADVSAEQSKFSHPDVCIVQTLLGYYHRGLTDEEVREAFEKLLRLDISEQEHQHGRWFSSVEPGLDVETRKALCDVRHISLTDARQFETLCEVFRLCMETINFFLNTCVFPKDTQQYPQRLSRTAWNLAAGGNSVGFSGTNDNHRLLPLSVAQKEPDYAVLRGTNGDMLHKIMHESHGYEIVRPSQDSSPIAWKSVLLYALSKGAQALIDTGALLAGVMNHEAANYLVRQPDFGFAGVTYFDNRDQMNCWMVAERERRLVMPLKESSMLEKETFVVFDEARSRGADMKLPPSAAAVLTLGPKLNKDKLMQGAGRMRQLGRNQTLWIASFDEVAQSILQTKATHCDVSDLTAVDVLNWVVHNTKAESADGLEWAGSGFHYRETRHDRTAEWVPEDWSLAKMYQDKLRAEKITHVIESKACCNFKDIDDDVVAQICSNGRKYGLEDEVCVTAHTDECERELKLEENVQEQQRVEVVNCSPAQEKPWNHAEILGAISVEDRDGVVRVEALESFICQWIYPKEFARLAWSTTRIFGTENFYSTILKQANVDQMNEFLRVIDVVLVFDNGQVLLVSECEADHILQLLWSASASACCSFRFLNLAFAWDNIGRFAKLPRLLKVDLALGSSLDRAFPLSVAASCHLYNGETMLLKDQQTAIDPICRVLLRPLAQRVATISNIVKSRGNGHKWTHSCLYKLCYGMDIEDMMTCAC